jgi:hypothetical protein
MIHLQKIVSLDQPELAPYRTMRRSAEHEAQRIFIAKGEKVTRRLLESRFKIVPSGGNQSCSCEQGCGLISH